MRYVDIWAKTLIFGLHDGKRLRDVPLSYLRWMLKGIDSLTFEERYAVTSEVADREIKAGSHYRHQAPPPPPPRSAPLQLPAGATAEALIEIAQAARRALALQHHPDVGGEDAKMKGINCTCDYLEQIGHQMSTGGASR